MATPPMNLDGEDLLNYLAAHRPPLKQLYYPSLESEVVGPYMAHRRRHFTEEAWIALVAGMHTSRTLYVGNLSFSTREEQVHALFSRVGPVRRVIMGLNSTTRTPCGFCFVEFEQQSDAAAATAILNGLKLDERSLSADLDQVFSEGRQYGRSKTTGGQLADDSRTSFDAGRGGWGAIVAARQAQKEARDRHRQAHADQFSNAETDGDGDDAAYYQTRGAAVLQLDDELPSADGATSTMFLDSAEQQRRRALQLNTSTIAVLNPSIFPHYALPIEDERIRKAYEQTTGTPIPMPIHKPAAAHIQTLASDASRAAASNSTSTAAAASSPVTAIPQTTPTLPSASFTASPPPRSDAPSPAAKRQRQHSPAYVPTSPPGSPPPTPPPPSAAALTPPRSPQPQAQPQARSPQPLTSNRSPQPMQGAHSPRPHTNANVDDDMGEAWSDVDMDDDYDRTPPPTPPPKAQDRHNGDNDDAYSTPPPTPPPVDTHDHHNDQDDDELAHDDRTPPYLSDNDNDDEHEHEHQRPVDSGVTADNSHEELDSDAPTPPPPEDAS